MPLDQQSFQLETDIKTLPDKPSELIRVSLLDLEKAENTPGYLVCMDHWHLYYDYDSEYPEKVGECGICLAGCVMAFSLRADRERELSPADFKGPDCSKLIVLDHFRSGSIGRGFRSMGLGEPPFELYDVEHYPDSPAIFKRDMRNLANVLEEAGY